MPSQLRRTLLFVPGIDERRFESALGSGADTLVFDLEDSVAPSRKGDARELVAKTLRERHLGTVEGAVRVNPAGSPEFERDVETVVAAGIRAIVLPKAEDPKLIAHLDGLLRGVEGANRRVRILPLVETPRGLLAAADLAAASSRVEALCFGHVDFATAMGVEASPDAGHGVLHHARCQLAIAAHAAKVTAIDSACLTLRDEARFSRDAAFGRDLGYGGKICVHPRQVLLTNRAYAPTEEQVTTARRLWSAWESARAAGEGTFIFEGKLIDGAIVTATQRLLARADTAEADLFGHPCEPTSRLYWREGLTKG